MKTILWAGLGGGVALIAYGITLPAPWVGFAVGLGLLFGCGAALAELSAKP